MKISSLIQSLALFLFCSTSIYLFSQSTQASVLLNDQLTPSENATLLEQVEPLNFKNDIAWLLDSEIPRLIWLARQNLNSGKFEQAREISEQVLAVKEYNVEALALSAAAYKGLGDQQSYLRVSNRVRQLAPHSPALPLALGTVYRIKNDNDAAEKVYLESLQTVLTQADLRMKLASLYMEQQRLQKAKVQYQHVLKQKGLSLKYTLNANFGLCRLDLKNKDYDQVKTRAKQLIDLYPPFPQSYQFLASAYLATNEIAKAITTYEKLITANPESPLPYQELTVIALDLLKNTRKAIGYAKEGLKHFPNDAKSHDVLGWAYFKQGNPKEASVEFQSATRLASDNAQFFYHLGLAHQQLGNKALARTSYLRSLGLINKTYSKLFKDELNNRIEATTED